MQIFLCIIIKYAPCLFTGEIEFFKDGKYYETICKDRFIVACTVIAVAAVGCTPISLNAEWAYKTDKVELPIGVYSYSLKTAYSQAQNYASKLASYDEASDSWLDLEITDDEGDKAVAREWIKNEADKMCLNYIAVDNLVEELGIDMTALPQIRLKKQPRNIGQ